MTTRAGTPYSPIQAQSSVAMDPNLETMLKGLNDLMAQLNQILAKQFPLDQPTPTIPLAHMNDRSKNPEVQVEFMNTQDLGYPQTEGLGKEEGKSEPSKYVYETNISLIDEYEGEDCEENNFSTLPEETFGKEKIIEPSPETSEQPKFSEDLVPVRQCPQEEPNTLASTQELLQVPEKNPIIILEDFPDDLQLPRSIPPVDQNSNLKVIMSSQGLFQDSPKLSQDSDSYFLPFLKSYPNFRAIKFHFDEITRMHELLKPIPFATYFWKTLWHLLGTHGKFSCAYQTRVKPRESLIC